MYFTLSAILTLLIVGKWIVESKPLKTITMISFIKKYWPSILFTLGLIGVGLVFLFVDGAAAKILSLLAFVGGIMWYYKTGQQN